MQPTGEISNRIRSALLDQWSAVLKGTSLWGYTHAQRGAIAYSGAWTQSLRYAPALPFYRPNELKFGGIDMRCQSNRNVGNASLLYWFSVLSCALAGCVYHLASNACSGNFLSCRKMLCLPSECYSQSALILSLLLPHLNSVSSSRVIKNAPAISLGWSNKKYPLRFIPLLQDDRCASSLELARLQ